MKIVSRTLFALLALFVFTLAFLAGRSPHVLAAGSDASDDSSDAGTDENATLPPDVRSRLSHISPGLAPQDFRPAVTFWEVLGKVKSRYVDKITDQDHLTHGAVASMLRSLRDPYSRVIAPEQLLLDQQEATGQFGGLGVILGARLSGAQAAVQDSPVTTQGAGQPGPPRRTSDSPDRAWQLVVVDTARGSAAAQAGLQTGDVVSKINDMRIERAPLAGKTIDDLNQMLNGPLVHSGTLTVTRGAAKSTRDIHMQAGGTTKFPAVQARMLSHGEAYVRIHLFTSSTPGEFTRALDSFAPSHPTSLLLDLRDNPGGLLSAGEAVVGTLTPGGIAGLLDVHGGTQKLPAPVLANSFAFPRLSVLTDAGTANIAELVAGALHERAGAKLVGAPTFGNGLVQTIYPLSQGWAFGLTTGRLRTANGADFNDHGLAVDHALGPDVLQGDAAVTAAASFLEPTR